MRVASRFKYLAMIELELTPKIKEWLDTEPEKRDLEAGAELLLRVSRNRILYANVRQNIKAKASTIEYHLNKIYVKRLHDTTHKQVHEMMVKVDAIDRARGLSKPEASVQRSDFQRGKRADHDELPELIQQLYVENGTIIRRMRDIHTKLRLISPDNSTCPDSDRYPLAKHLIELDSVYRENWNKYDHYIKGTPAETVAAVKEDRTTQLNAAKYCNLMLGKYSRNKSEEIGARIKESYASIDTPSAALTEKMKSAGLL